MGAQAIVALSTLLLISVPLNIVQFTAWLLLPRRLGRLVNHRCYCFVAYVLVLWCDHMSNLELVYYGDDLPERESAILISNHLSAEFLHFTQLAYRHNMMAGCRFVQKSPLKWIPINWTCYLHESPFIARGEGPAAREQAMAVMRNLLGTLGEDRLPIWLILFPEGTWVAGPEEKFILERSQAYAKKAGLPLLKNVLTPRAGGFSAAVEGAISARKAAAERTAAGGTPPDPSQIVSAVYDVTFAYDTPIHPVELGRYMPPSVLRYVGGAPHGTPRKLHLYVNRVPLDPEAEGADPLLASDPAAYVQRSFEEKEQLLRGFGKDAAFPRRHDRGRAEPPARGLYLRLLLCLAIVLGSFAALHSVHPLLLGGYLGVIGLLCMAVAANVSWDEGEALPASLSEAKPASKRQ